MKVLKAITAIVFVLAFSYGLISFVNLDLNFFDWRPIWRAAFLILVYFIPKEINKSL